MKKIISLITAAALLFALCSCSALPQKSGFTAGVLDEINTFSPQKARGDAELIAAVNCFEGLMRINESGCAAPAGATAYSVSSDGLEYTFRLNPKARWHLTEANEAVLEAAGIKPKYFSTSVTAADYKDSFIRAIEEKAPMYETLLCIKGAAAFSDGKGKKENIGIEAEDDFTLKITLEKPCRDILTALAMPVALPESSMFIKAAGSIYGTTVSTVVCNGNYYPKEYSPTGTLTLLRNPDYKGISNTLNASVTLYYTGRSASLKPRFEDGTYDTFISADAGIDIGVKASGSHRTEVWGVVFNGKSEALNDINLRLALACATDFDSIKKPSFAAAEAAGIFPPSYTAGEKCYSDIARECKKEFFPSRAKSYFAEVKNLPVKLKIRVPEELEADFADICALWSLDFDEKIETTLSVFGVSDAPQIAAEGDYDIAVLPLKADFPTARAAIESMKGAPCYRTDKNIEALIEKAESSGTEQYESALSQVQSTVINSVYFIPLFDAAYSLYLADGVSGIYTAQNEKMIYFNAGIRKGK